MSRLYSSPSRNWIMQGNRHSRGLPPQCPNFTGRRGSNTPISPMALLAQPQVTPNRSRSLDGLLDSEPGLSTSSEPPVTTNTPSEHTAHSCESLLPTEETTTTAKINEQQTEELATNLTEEESKEKSPSLDNNSLDDPIDTCDKESSTLSLHSNSSDSKRKRNFMDRCVNKVRSLIKK